MKFFKTIALAAASITLAGFFCCGYAEAEEEKTRVGRADIERVYNEYYLTGQMEREFQRIQAEFMQAQQEGEQEKLAELEQEFTKMQQEFHSKFETGLDDAAREICEESDIGVIVVEVIYSSDDVDVVDVSGEIIRLMNKDAPESEEEIPVPIPGG